MATLKLGGANGRTLDLQESETLIAVRTRSHGPINSSRFSKSTRSAMRKVDPEVVFEGQDISVLRSEEITGDELKKALKAEDQIEFAGTALKIPETGRPVAYTERIFLALQKDAKEDAIAAVMHQLGDRWFVARRLAYGQLCFLLQPRKAYGRAIFDQALEILERSEVDRCHPEFLRERDFKSVFPEQWHLGKRLIDGNLIAQSANVDGAWALSRGAGTTIAVIDDGVDTQHPEFSAPGKITAEYDFTQHVPDASPKHSNDNHGTACAGVACAAGSHGASGVAPDARLMPIRLRSALGSMDESDAIMWAVQNGADVISCSWGPKDGKWWDPSDPQHDVFAPISDNSALALEAAMTTGRQGRGCVVCWAAGNGNESADLDGYASFDGVMAVAACSDRGDRSVYSDTGDAIDCAFPSNNFEFGGSPAPLTSGIWTTDRRSNKGYNQKQGTQGNFTDGFGGTSSACPGAAGTAALLLAIDPFMTGAEVQQAMKETADKIDSENGNYDASGHSASFGFGRVNAENAVLSRLQLV